MSFVHTVTVKLGFTGITYKLGRLMHLFVNVACCFHSPVGQTGTKATHKQLMLRNFVCPHIVHDTRGKRTVRTCKKGWPFAISTTSFLLHMRRLCGHIACLVPLRHTCTLWMWGTMVINCCRHSTFTHIYGVAYDRCFR